MKWYAIVWGETSRKLGAKKIRERKRMFASKTTFFLTVSHFEKRTKR